MGFGFEGAINKRIKCFVEIIGGLDVSKQYKGVEDVLKGGIINNPRRYYFGVKCGARFMK